MNRGDKKRTKHIVLAFLSILFICVLLFTNIEAVHATATDVYPTEETETSVETAVEETTDEEWDDSEEAETESLSEETGETEEEPVTEEEITEPQTEVIIQEVPTQTKAVTLYQGILASDGSYYDIFVTADEDSGIPEDASLSVTEMLAHEEEYETYLTRTEDALGEELQAVYQVRLFDITILDNSGQEIEPAEGSLVRVDIQTSNETEQMQVVHLGEAAEVMETEKEGAVVSFETTGFSVYALVYLNTETEYEWKLLADMADFEEYAIRGVYVKNPGGYYFTSTKITIQSPRTGIQKVGPLATAKDSTKTVKYYFIPAGNGQYLAYCMNPTTNARQYVQLNTNSLSFVSNQEDATPFLVETFPGQANTFRLSAVSGGTRYYWNMQGGNNGKAFAAYNNATDTNARIQFDYCVSGEDDIYHLNGKSYYIVFNKEDIKSIAMTTRPKQVETYNRLEGEVMRTRRDIVNDEGVVVLSSDAQLPKFTFENIEKDKYYVSTRVNGVKKYLTASSNGLTLESVPSEDSAFHILQGTGAYDGKYRFLTDAGYTIRLPSESAANGFAATKTVDNTSWLNFAEEIPDLEEEDFVPYVAKKVSVSDLATVQNGVDVIVYTRLWNPNTSKYDFYLIDYNGRLLKCTESGDSLRWFGGQVNTALWKFTEYYYEGTTDPNFYYELQNNYSELYIAPQLEGTQVLSDSKIGINMMGRRYGDPYTTLLAWDDVYYDYAGLKVVDGQLVPCPMAQAIPFYFAMIEDNQTAEGLTTVETVDNNEYGITMQMVDFNGPLAEGHDRNKQQTDLLGFDTNPAGLVKPYLESNGYPLTNPEQTGQPQNSLNYLFNNMTTVNHLFSSKTYMESGYFEYDSTQTAAYLADGENFTVYNQLVTMPGGSNSLNHGQFMPYNSLINPATGELWPYSTTHSNTNNTLNEELPDSNPRKGEPLLQIPGQRNAYPYANTQPPYVSADYFFGMQMDASFTQTPSGLDAWGHDIIFEFSGDDDMWLYVDGRLILDIGGVHSASTGSVNFRTGEVNLIVKTNQNKVIPERTETTNLRELFTRSYMEENPNATPADLDAFLANYFSPGENMFKDYSNHTMKMFYMERGASASNLHMRFNLTSVKPGHMVLNKILSGTEEQDFNFASFPYQIYYQTKNSPVFQRLTQDMTNPTVVYQNTSEPVTFQSTFAPAGTTTQYEDVFFLKAGQHADVAFPENTVSYYVVECGINPAIYDVVLVNGDAYSSTQNGTREDYATPVYNVDEQPQIFYENHVDANALRNFQIKKVLYAEDEQTILTREDDPTTFDLRLALGAEDDATISPANMVPYHIRDAAGDYCVWDVSSRGFTSLHKNNYDDLTDEEKQRATFTTSPNGSISRIPSEYTIELIDLPVGTRFRVEERDYEIPAGYRLMDNGYVRIQGSYIIEDEDYPNVGIIRSNADPVIEVHNQRGWELTVNKIWSDTDYVASHADIYVALYNRNTGTLIPNTVKVIKAGTTETVYFFDRLEPGMNFTDYQLQEVTLTGNIVEDANGYITGYDTITRIQSGGSLHVDTYTEASGTPVAQTYRALYEDGQAEGANNHVRGDTVTNIRNGLQILKTDMAGNILEGSTFTLVDVATGQTVGADTYTSDETGLVTIAYIPDGTYTLTEVKSTTGYHGLNEPITIVKSGATYTIQSTETTRFAYDTTGDMPTLTVKNKPFEISLLKIEEETNVPLEGVRFAVYRQVMGNHGPRRDYRPMPGFEVLETDEDGMLEYPFHLLPAGTFYIHETKPLDGYATLDNDIVMTISPNGVVSFEQNPQLTVTQGEDNTSYTYMLTVTNYAPSGGLLVTKTVTGNMGDKTKEFRFTVSFVEGRMTLPDEIPYEKEGIGGMVSLDDGYVTFTLRHGESILFSEIPSGTEYYITEDDYSTEGYTITSAVDTDGEIPSASNAEAYITNHKQIAIPTEIYDTPLLPLMLVIGTALLGLFGWKLYSRKRKGDNVR